VLFRSGLATGVSVWLALEKTAEVRVYFGPVLRQAYFQAKAVGILIWSIQNRD
jgi:hypothetical protein